MAVIFESFFIIIGSSLGLLLLGLATGFSPVLYVAQIAGAAQSKRPTHAMRSLIAGVLVGTLLPALLFAFFNPSTLTQLFDMTVKPVIVSAWFQVILGSLFIIAGLWTLATSPRQKKKPVSGASKKGPWVLFGAGVLRTMTSASGLVSIYFATQILFRSAGGPLTVAIPALIFLIGVLLPFAILYALWQKSPGSLEEKSERLVNRLSRIRYRPVVGTLVTLAGVLTVVAPIIQL